MNKSDWKDSVILILINFAIFFFELLFVYIVEYNKVDAENKFLKEKIEEQKAIIEKMESYRQ